jgi:hypothetical protein
MGILPAHEGQQNSRMTVPIGRGVDRVLAEARNGVQRCTPRETEVARLRGALVIDIRTETQRAEIGELPGAIVIDRTVLEWRLDPACDARIAEAPGTTLKQSWCVGKGSVQVWQRKACAGWACIGRPTWSAG